MPRKSYTIGEIARICQVTPTTVYRWIVDGKMPSFKTAGGRNRVWEDDALKLFESLDIPSSKINGKSKAPRILIVDDEPTIRRLVRRLVQPVFPKAILDEAVDGYEAGFKTRDQRPHLVIFDLNLPKVDGVKVCKMIKENEDLKRTKVLVITGGHPEMSKKDVFKAGADAFLPKPFGNDELVQQVKALLPDYLD